MWWSSCKPLSSLKQEWKLFGALLISKHNKVKSVRSSQISQKNMGKAERNAVLSINRQCLCADKVESGSYDIKDRDVIRSVMLIFWKTKFDEKVTFSLMLKCKETFGEEYEKAIGLSTMQLLLSTRNQEPHPAPVWHKIYKMNVSNTTEMFRILEESDVVYVETNVLESPTKVDEQSRKSKTKKKNLYKIWKGQPKTVSVVENVVHGRTSNNGLFLAKKRSRSFVPHNCLCQKQNR